MSLKYWIFYIINVLLVVGTVLHALLYKRDPMAALGWIAVSILFPLGGPLLYFLFGINRVRTRAKKLARRSPFHISIEYERFDDDSEVVVSNHEVATEFREIVRLSDAVTRRPIVGGNRIQLLHNGEQAYPVMLDAIKEAQHTLYMSTYLFETDETGQMFIDTLTKAAQRGVDVRVIIDGIGEYYSIPRAGTILKKRGVRISRFIPPKLIPPSVHINLRNHRKILVADGRIGFVGGMNI
ncbi:MAG: phospholipase D-like domain-containing protein, partial [Syntrophales bacterium]